MSKPVIYTVGHSNTPVEAFIEKLTRNGITAIADVRSTPYSQWVPQFNKEALEAVLGQSGIAYVHLGRELGARREEACCYQGGRVHYERVAETELFRTGIQRVLDGSAKLTIALMCAEKEPLDCHRTVLVARNLIRAGAEIRHVLGDGSVEHHEDTMDRLFDLVRLDRTDLFKSEEELAADAYAKREVQIAPVQKEWDEVETRDPD